MAVAGRRSVVAAAAAGLVVSAFAAPAGAATPSEKAATTVPAVDTSTLTSSARAAMETSPVVKVAADASWTLDAPDVKIVADPKPVAAPVVKVKAARASRSSVRSAAPAARAVAKGAIPQSVAGNAVLEVASRYIGVMYRWGGKTPAGFDCSGFTAYVYGQLGISIPSSTAALRGVGTVVSRADALPGDLILTSGHVAIYAGGDLEIDAPKPGGSVQFHAIWQTSPKFIRIG